jgi:4-hydroxyphenylpyruvate dioxygenase
MQFYNPAGTDGFDFLEFSTKEPDRLHQQFLSMGFKPIAKHQQHNIIIYQQNDIKFIMNTAENSLASQFAFLHGPSTSAMGFRVIDADFALQHAVINGAKVCKEGAYRCPAIYGVGGSVIYFVDYKNNASNYLEDFSELPQTTPEIRSAGLTYLDHVTHNLHRGNMDKWAEFYEKIFNFKEIRYFDIEGKLTGLKSRAMTSPCGKIRIPLNESSDDKSQIEEFLKDFNGEGIQHIALGTSEIFATVEQLKEQRLEFLDTPDTYYDLLEKRLPKHGEDVERLRKNRILLDGTTGLEKKLLLQIFTKNMLGPVFFEIIQRKGDEGFGEGNFKALFESIELDQIKRGVLT